MKSVEAIIIDDEPAAREVLFSLLFRFCKEVDVVAEAADLEAGSELIKKHNPDVVFLDIQMPNYDGYEITRFFKNIDFSIIFVTAYNHYALKAFEISALDYLLKPLEVSRLKAAVQKVSEKKNNEVIQEQYHLLSQMLSEKRSTRIAVFSNRDKYFINIEDIVALKAESSYCRIITVDSNEHVLSKNLKQTSELISDWDVFFRCHKSWLINLSMVKSYSKLEGEVLLPHGLKVKLSRYKIREFCEAIEKV